MRQATHIFFLSAIVVLAAFTTCGAQAQGKDDITFRRSLPTARSVALGEAFVADIGEASSASVNPAGLSFLESLAATLTAVQRTDERLARTEMALPLWASEHATLSLAAEYASFGPRSWRDEAGRMMGAGLGYSVRLLEPFSLGLIYNLRSVELGAGARRLSHSAGVGMMYAVLPSLTYGVSVTGLGSGYTYKRSAEGVGTLEREGSIPRVVSFGASWRYPATHDRPIVAMYLSNESISGESRLVYRLGAEVSPWAFLALRGGVISGPQTAMGRAGVGLRLGGLEIDYAMASSVAAERLHVLTVTVPLSSQ